MKYRKKPIEIEAHQFTGGAAAATPIIDWVLANGGTASWHEEYIVPEDDESYDVVVPEGIRIRTLEGDMNAGVGWWVIRGIKGEFYPCKPAIFAATYEPVDTE